MCTMSDQRQRRWSDVVQMLYKCFVFSGQQLFCIHTSSPQKHILQLVDRHDTEAGCTCNVTIVKGNKVYAYIVDGETVAII